MKLRRTYKYRLNPNKKQAAILESTLELDRDVNATRNILTEYNTLVSGI